jgi:hypothetical protein
MRQSLSQQCGSGALRYSAAQRVSVRTCVHTKMMAKCVVPLPVPHVAQFQHCAQPPALLLTLLLSVEVS